MNHLHQVWWLLQKPMFGNTVNTQIMKFCDITRSGRKHALEQPLFLFSQHLGKLVSWSSHILLCYIGLTQQNKLQGERRTTKFFSLLSDSLQLQALPKHWQKAFIWTATDLNEHILNLNVYQRGIQFQTVNHEMKKNGLFNISSIHFSYGEETRNCQTIRNLRNLDYINKANLHLGFNVSSLECKHHMGWIFCLIFWLLNSQCLK